jgi:hypothetical protein
LQHTIYNPCAHHAPVVLATAIAVTSTYAASENNFGKVMLTPGASETCNSLPCIVYFVMPPENGN